MLDLGYPGGNPVLAVGPFLMGKVKKSLQGLVSDDPVNRYLCGFYYKIQLSYQFGVFGLLELMLYYCFIKS